jgi:Domain of unknown function (DUF6265)
MKRNFICISLIILLTGFVGFHENISDKMKAFKWLIGSWQMNTAKGFIAEEWKTSGEQGYAGKSWFINKDSSTTPFEIIQLVYRNKQYYYIATADGQNNELPVEFKITAFSSSGFVAENPQHDFPKRITYRLINKDSIHAWIDAGPPMPEKKSDFYYTRIKK